MSSAESAARIPQKHSAAKPRQDPRSATSRPHESSKREIATDNPSSLSSSSDSIPNRGIALAADKVDSQVKSSASSVKSRTHSRLASFGRRRSRASINQQQQPKSPTSATSQGETSTPAAPVSPSDTASHKQSDTSTLSYRSSKTTLSDNAERESKSADERPSFLLSSSNIPAELAKPNRETSCDSERPQRLAQSKPRTMHQTSSKLLRMTDDERPFTRVRIEHTSFRSTQPSFAPGAFRNWTEH